jgi:hypothetical protein
MGRALVCVSAKTLPGFRYLLFPILVNHPHARETGELELETLVNTFLVYTPMQLIATSI